MDTRDLAEVGLDEFWTPTTSSDPGGDGDVGLSNLSCGDGDVGLSNLSCDDAHSNLLLEDSATFQGKDNGKSKSKSQGKSQGESYGESESES